MGCQQITSQNHSQSSTSKSLPQNTITSSYKNKSNPDVTISVATKEINWSRSFDKALLFKDVIKQFKEDNTSSFPIYNDCHWLINEHQVSLDTTIHSVLPSNKENQNEMGEEHKEIILKLTYIVDGWFDWAPDYEKGIINSTNIIAKPFYKTERFQMLVFNLSLGTIIKDKYSRLFTKEKKLNYFPNKTAYCNGGNYLFLSGGETNGVISDYFWEINLNNKDEITIQTLWTPVKLHSMVYIPNDYVFWIGGNTKNVQYYTRKGNKIINYCDWNEQRIEPSWCVVDSYYIYAFSNNARALSFEKTNLRKRPSWELIKPVLHNCNLLQKFFGVFNNSDTNTICFIGGQIAANVKITNNVEFNYKTNELKESKLPYEQFKLSEKTFLPLHSHRGIAMCDFTRISESKVLIWSQIKSSIIKISLYQGKDDIDWLWIDNANIKLFLKNQHRTKKGIIGKLNFSIREQRKSDIFFFTPSHERKYREYTTPGNDSRAYANTFVENPLKFDNDNDSFPVHEDADKGNNSNEENKEDVEGMRRKEKTYTNKDQTDFFSEKY